MAEIIHYDLIVIGAGPGGYVAAIRGAQLGMKVALVEKRETPGGVCLNEGCIPSKALLESSSKFSGAFTDFVQHGIEISEPKLNLETMMRRKDGVVKKLADGISYLLKRNEIKFYQGNGVIFKNGDGKVAVSFRLPGQMSLLEEQTSETLNDNQNETVIVAEHIILATGSEEATLPGIPFDHQTVVSSREALSFTTVPDHLVIAGGGYIGLELGSVWQRLGSQVTIIEMLPQILPNMDRQIADYLYKLLRKQGINFKLGTRITGVRRIGSKAIVQFNDGTGVQEIDCDRLLVAVGRRPVTAGLFLEELALNIDERGRVIVDENYQTSIEGVYAIGDLIAGPMLAHKASQEGTVCVERIKGYKTLVEYELIPSVCYTSPEAASIGKTEEQLKESSIPYKVGRSDFTASGRARAAGMSEGFVKILIDRSNEKVLGVHIIGEKASELIAEATMLMAFQGNAQDIALTCHAHPTLSETLREAALDALGQGIH